MHSAKSILALAVLAACACTTSAFSAGGMRALALRQPRVRSSPTALRMGLEEITYVIHSDGRVEEKVTGIKGKQCHEVTAEVEELLGKVTYTQPTSEAFEEKVQLTTSEEQTETIGGQGSGGSGWSQY